MNSAGGNHTMGYEINLDEKDVQEPSAVKSKSKKGVDRIFRRFADRCSMQGPYFIMSSTWWLPRSLWTVLLVAAIGVMSFHLYYLCKTFFAWPTKNKITLGFSSLQFPAVTICNVNRVRASRLNNLSQDFQDLVALVHPDNIGNVIGNLSQDNDERRRRRDTSSDDYDTQLNDIDFGLSGKNFTNAREEVDDDFHDENLDGYSNTWESEATESKFVKLKERFRELYSSENRPTRIAAGHHLKNMLVSCAFNGKSCYPSNFTLSTSTTYGNCYTLQYDKFVSRRSGPIGGLELLIYLDLDEYIRGVSPDDGLQVTIHPRNTMPFPYDEGVAVAAGTHTKLSLKLVQIERLGDPYSVCFDSTDYLQKYGVEYSRQTCQKFCEQRLIHRSCNCHDETEEDLNRIIMAAGKWFKPCRNKTEMHCMIDAQWRYRMGNVQCQCQDPCQESKYVKSMSFRQWPHKDYAEGVLLRTVCRRESSAKCQKLQNKSGDDLSREFVKLDIYYEDLNYENITEEADYENVQFYSDVGGTLGLWIGLSILSIMEVLQLVVELFRYLCCCRWNQRQPPVSQLAFGSRRHADVRSAI